MKLAIVKFLLFLCYLAFNTNTQAQTIEKLLNSSRNDSLLYDHASIFNLDEKHLLEQKLIAYSDSTSTQIVIITVKSLEGYPLENTASEIGQKWGVGQKETDNGIVILFSENDREITIRTAYGVQVHLPPTIAKIIIEEEMIPFFKTGNYYQGFDNGTNAIFQFLDGKYDANAAQEVPDFPLELGLALLFLFIFILFIYFLSQIGKKGGNFDRKIKRNSWDDVIISNTGSSSWDSDSSSSWDSSDSDSSFGGFGGGSFGGGGASGSW